MASSPIGDAPDPGDLDRFELFAEQFAVAADLLRSGGLARERTALVAIDNIAEILLYRHLQFTFDASESMSGRLAGRRYDQRQRDRLRQDFDRRVTLALAEPSGVLTFSYPRPLLDELDAATFRVAHRYRNGAYHEDRHNDALVATIAGLYLTAAGRAWCRSQTEMTIGGLSSQRLRALPHIAKVADRGSVTLPRAAKEIVAALLEGLEVVPRELAEQLATDLTQRAAGTESVRAELVNCGLSADAHAEMLRAAELRRLHRADPGLVRLQDEASALLGRLTQEQTDDSLAADLQARFHEAENHQQQRIDELRASFRPELGLGTAKSIGRAASRLGQLRDVGRLLTRYEVLDARVRLLEECLAWIDREWDRHMSLQVDIARGK